MGNKPKIKDKRKLKKGDKVKVKILRNLDNEEIEVQATISDSRYNIEPDKLPLQDGTTGTREKGALITSYTYKTVNPIEE